MTKRSARRETLISEIKALLHEPDTRTLQQDMLHAEAIAAHAVAQINNKRTFTVSPGGVFNYRDGTTERIPQPSLSKSGEQTGEQ